MLDKELYDQLLSKAREVDTRTQWEELAEGNFKKLKEQCQMAETYVNKFMDKKNDRIQQLKDQVHEVREGKKSEREYSKHLKSYYRQRKTSIQL